jgi:ATP-dependent Clp protease ATP-binding subunit ClpA
MQRLIQDTVRKALADELLFGRLVNGGSVLVDVDAENQVILEIHSATVKGKAASAETSEEI